jgi:hypothetical protein
VTAPSGQRATQTTPPSAEPPNDLVISYLALRRAVGIIGMALPFVVALGRAILDRPVLQATVSDYYYTVMRDVFVGSLCAIGAFMMSYRGYDEKDWVAGRCAAVFAVGAAFFPTAPENAAPLARVIGMVHLACATGLFITLAIFCKLFRKSKGLRTRQKDQRNLIYGVCGLTILACIGLIFVYAVFLMQTPLARFQPIFWLEALAIVAFGVSWLIKGETLLKDR